MEKLYSIKLSDKKERQELYVRLVNAKINSYGIILIGSNSKADFLTYFNGFSVGKWRQYTSLSKINVSLKLEGKCRVIFKHLNSSGIKIISEDIVDSAGYTKTIDVRNYADGIIGFELQGLQEQSTFTGATYFGEFEQWEETKIGVVICTFKREQYVLKTIGKLSNFAKQNSWLFTTVVDNGSTLDEISKAHLRILHNPNYGGSGGFTRGIIETINQDISTHVLLMDDDIDLDTTSLERMHSLLCGLRETYRNCFLGGAMLNMDIPNEQYENCAYWHYVHLVSMGKGIDLSNIDNILSNETRAVPQKNLYAAWWYCCMPIHRILQNGYPIPVFVKGDDMEYGIRNKQDIINMNGICVWHEPFAKKVTPEVNYYSDRNMLIINNFAENCGFLTFALASSLRLIKRMMLGNKRGIEMYYCALSDYMLGFEGITQEPPFNKMLYLKGYKSGKNIVSLFFTAFQKTLAAICSYNKIHKQYVDFRTNKLMNTKFWLQYLDRGNMH